MTFPPGVCLGLDHVAIAVANLDEAIDLYKKNLGIEPVHRETVAEQGVEEALLRADHCYIQLICPLRPDTPVGKFISKRGPGLHHVAYRVADVRAAITSLKAQGARLIDEAPRRGSRNTKIAFVHPSSMGGVLVELVEHPTAQRES